MTTVTQAVAARRSIRAFEDRPVPREILERVLDKARMAPSSTNFQPWEPVILTGAPLHALSAQMLAEAGSPSPDFDMSPATVPDIFPPRRDALMAHRMAALGIARDDKAGRDAYQRNNFRFFGAPVVLLTFYRRGLPGATLGSVGLWLQTVILLLQEEGLGTCLQESLAHHTATVCAAAGKPLETHIFWCGLSIGWPDMTAPVNNYERPRIPLSEQATFLGFD